VLFGATLTTSNWASRTVVYRVMGFGDYDYGVMPTRYLMEFPVQVIIYVLFVSGVWLYDRAQAEREAALRAAQLDTQLKQAQLQGLRLQLQPHFLFNALNTISSTMYDDPRAADTMLSRLAELLRVSLRTTQTQEVPLAIELETLDHYVALLRARFGEGLQWRVTVEDGVRQALVPSLMLQPLVENAVRHGNLARIGVGHVTVSAARVDDRLRVQVADDGPGIDPGEDVAEKGIGLAATRERLRLLYGDAQALTLHTAAARDRFTVDIDLPLRLADGAIAPAREAAPLTPEPSLTQEKLHARAHR
jgi:LytS/YehU family sensor histidine kinase